MFCLLREVNLHYKPFSICHCKTLRLHVGLDLILDPCLVENVKKVNKRLDEKIEVKMQKN